MAIINNNVVMKGVSGHIGKQVVIRQLHGKTVLSTYPDMSKRKLTPKQLEVNKRMKEADSYAQRIIKNDELKSEALDRLKATPNKLYTSLVREYFEQAKKKNVEM